jgi:hypothetical protein
MIGNYVAGRAMVATLASLLVGACGSANRAELTGRYAKSGTLRYVSGVKSVGKSSPTVRIMMGHKNEIGNTEEATRAHERANRTQAEIVRLVGELKQTDVRGRERSDKEKEISELRQRHKREIDRVAAFYQRLAQEVK